MARVKGVWQAWRARVQGTHRSDTELIEISRTIFKDAVSDLVKYKCSRVNKLWASPRSHQATFKDVVSDPVKSGNKDVADDVAHKHVVRSLLGSVPGTERSPR